MLTVITIIGRPNVGKSTLFNRLTRSRDALVANRPGITRDRHYACATHNERDYMLVDTGGIGGTAETGDDIAALVTEQTMQAIDEADAVIWLVDAQTGMTAADATLADQLRRIETPVYLVVNKTEGLDADMAVAEFYACGGFDNPRAISAQRGDGVEELMDGILQQSPASDDTIEIEHTGTKIAVIGRPNVGKSTLVNRMLGEERMLTFDEPGTTRDSIAIPFTRQGKQYVLIDTAGIRRRSKIDDRIEKFSVIKSLQALTPAQVVILVLDAQDAITEQDQHLLGIIHDSGKSLIIAINKWDGLDQDQRQKIEHQFSRKTAFLDYASTHRISALHGTGVGKLFSSVNEIMEARQRLFKSSEITGWLSECVQANPPPLHRGRRIKLRYAHLGGNDPVRI
ncbi:MAG: ribosome biogenesis GTPase Der, partial [Gammaproteobacteria bacterium]